MRLSFGIFSKKVVLDYGFKEPDFISKKEVKQYAEVDQLSRRLRLLNKKIKRDSKLFGKTEFFVRCLSPEEITVLERKGFYVRLRNKTLRHGQVKLIKDQYLVTV